MSKLFVKMSYVFEKISAFSVFQKACGILKEVILGIRRMCTELTVGLIHYSAVTSMHAELVVRVSLALPVNLWFSPAD